MSQLVNSEWNHTSNSELVVCVLIVTYGDRWDHLSRVLEAVSGQTSVVSHAILVDNGGSYLNEARLSSFGLKIVLEKLERNFGSAEGFKRGLEVATRQNPDLIWMLDDDNWPEPSALEEALRVYRECKCVVSGNRVTPQGCFSNVGRIVKNGFLGFSISDLSSHRTARSGPVVAGRSGCDGETADDGEVRPFAPYGGLLISPRMVAQIGLPRTDFVTYSDDTEWTARIPRAGGVIRRADLSVIRDLEAFWNTRKARLNPLVSPSAGLYRVYYAVRNQTYLEFSSASNKGLFFINAFIRLSVLALNLLLFSPAKRKSLLRFNTLLRAAADGVRGKLGYRPNYENAR